MTWSIENSKNNESAKIRWELIPYCNGRSLDIGCGLYKVLPHFIGVDSGKQWGNQGVDVQSDADDLSLFSSRSCDLVYSSHLLEHVKYDEVPKALDEWFRVTKMGGHVIVYVPDEDDYPKVGEFGANPDHKWNCSYQSVVDAFEKVQRGWDLVDFQKRNEEDEYSLFFVFKLTPGKAHTFSWQNKEKRKTCAVIRYGAIGDAIMVSSILPGLKAQGYWIDYYCQSGQGYEAIKHDPNVDRFIIQSKDMVPPPFLEEFWSYTRKKYDKWINLCESVECSLLASPGRASWEWPNKVKEQYMDKNYLEWTHDIAEVPPPYQPKFYSTLEERAWASKTAQRMGAKNILWSLSGSSGHKVWPHLDAVIARILLAYKDVHIVLCGDEFCRLLETGWEKEPRVHCVSGKWTIRESLCFAEVADIIIGTETGLLNGASSMDAWKIVTLSHSSQEMLTKHWKNVIALEQPDGIGCEKKWKSNGGACRQLHGGNSTSPWLDCPQEDVTGTALCQYHVNEDMMWGAITRILGIPMRKVA